VLALVKCGNDNTTGLDGILIEGSKNRSIGCHMQNNTRYGFHNNGFRNTFTGCVSVGKNGVDCHAFYEDTGADATVISGCSLIGYGSQGLYVDGGSTFPLQVTATDFVPSAGGGPFLVAAGKVFYKDGIKISPVGSGDAKNVLTLDIFRGCATLNGEGGQFRIETSTIPAQSGISIRGVRDADGGHGSWHFYTRNASGELERVTIDKNGIVGINQLTPVISGTGKLHMTADTMRLDTARTPASAAAAGNAGEICWDANYLYICVATNTWKRVAIATW